MYISKYTVEGLRWIDTRSGIKSITADIQNQVQLVIGVNGGGKSTLLNQLTPLPASKNDYYRKGFKELTIFHKGDEYILRSDFETKQGKHSFLKNGAELNVSGLSSLQIDLCRQHLDYTPQLDDLVHCRFKMTQMSLAERKALLLSLSPSTPDFVVQLHKQAKSMLRSCKANMTLLQTRKAEIEEKLFSEEELKDLQERSTALNSKYLEIANAIYGLKEDLKRCKTELDTFQEVKAITPEIANQYKKKTQLLLYKHPELDPSERTTKELEDTLLVYQTQLVQLNSEYQKLTEELKSYDANILEQQDTGIKECEESIEQKTNIIADLGKYLAYPAIAKDTYDKHEQVFEELKDLLNNHQCLDVIYSPNYLKSWSALDKIREAVAHVKEVLYTTEAELKTVKEQLAQSLKLVSEQPEGPNAVDPTVNCTSCGYFNYFSRIKDKETAKIKTLTDRERYLSTKSLRYREAGKRLVALGQAVSMADKHLQAIETLLAPTVWKTTKHALINTLTGETAKQDYLKSVQMTLQAQEYIKTAKQLSDEISEIRTTMEALKKLNAPAINILKQLYLVKQTQLDKIREQTLSLESNVSAMESQLKAWQDLDALKLEGEELQEQVVVYTRYNLLKAYIDYLENGVMTTLTEEKNTVTETIVELTKVLQEQSNLKSRYEEEILKLMETITKKEELYTYLELGLSPETGMPQYQLRLFINAILDNVNFILDKIWTSSFRVALIAEGDDITCDFKASVNDKSYTPINRLSKSEQAVVNFAFYIALIYATGSTDYPVYFDECDDGFDVIHKNKYLEWLKMYTDSMYSPQLWIICHDAALYGGLSLFVDITCLNGEGITVPPEANKHVKIEKH